MCVSKAEGELIGGGGATRKAKKRGEEEIKNRG